MLSVLPEARPIQIEGSGGDRELAVELLASATRISASSRSWRAVSTRMGLSLAFVDAHIRGWEQKLKGGAYPHREHWPRYLFHHAPLENAVKILTSGRLSRIHSDQVRGRDVAGFGVIDCSQRAHHFARLYFRPRTPTQYHIEGIRRPGNAGTRICPRAGANYVCLRCASGALVGGRSFLGLQYADWRNRAVHRGVFPNYPLR